MAEEIFDEEEFNRVFGGGAPAKRRTAPRTPRVSEQTKADLATLEGETQKHVKAMEGAQAMEEARQDPFVAKRAASAAERAREDRKIKVLSDLLRSQRQDLRLADEQAYGPILGPISSGVRGAAERTAEALGGPESVPGLAEKIGRIMARVAGAPPPPPVTGAALRQGARAKEFAGLVPAAEKQAEEAALAAEAEYLKRAAGIRE